MINKNLKNFGDMKIVRRKPETKKAVVLRSTNLRMDGVARAAVVTKVKKHKTLVTPKVVSYNRAPKPKPWFNQRVSVLAACAALLLAFAGGAWFTLNTSNSLAEDETQSKVLAAHTEIPKPAVDINVIDAPNKTPQADNDALFNTPIQQLQSYFDSIKEPDVIYERKLGIESLLKDMNSPFIPAAETIAQQEHWKLILAIAFAESTMGKNCTDNNCSNIGVAPGHQLWRKYESYSAWVIDFNRLLEKRYKDYTLQDMCGVYVQPCNQNWLIATQQILDKIEERKIQ